MMTIKLLSLFVPTLLTMLALWMNSTCLNTMPKHAYTESRRLVFWGTLFLFALVVELGMASYMAVNMIHNQHQQSMQYGK